MTRQTDGPTQTISTAATASSRSTLRPPRSRGIPTATCSPHRLRQMHQTLRLRTRKRGMTSSNGPREEAALFARCLPRVRNRNLPGNPETRRSHNRTYEGECISLAFFFFNSRSCYVAMVALHFPRTIILHTKSAFGSVKDSWRMAFSYDQQCRTLQITTLWETWIDKRHIFVF